MPKLLIIDAHDYIGISLSTLLGQYGIDAIFVSNTDEAKFLLSIEHYHVILLDPMIGETNKDYVSTINGLNFYQYLLNNYKDIPIIIYTAYIDTSLLKEFQQATAVLCKPVTYEELIKIVAKCMGANTSGIKLPPENPRGKIQIFISYAKDDQEKAQALYRLLSHEGYSPWIDTAILLPGQDWEVEINRAIENSHFVIACLSKNSVTKEGYIQKELKIALDMLDEKPFSTIYLIPIRLDDCTVPYKFQKLQWFEMFDNNSAELLLKAVQTGCEQRKLLKKIDNMRGK